MIRHIKSGCRRYTPAGILSLYTIRNALLIAAFFVLFSSAACFAQSSLKAEVDKLKLTTDDTLTYKLTVNASGEDVSLPQVPKFKGFRVVSQLQSSNIAFVKDGIKTGIVYSFILVPKETGRLKIEPSTLKIKSKTYSSEEFEIEVTQGKARPEAQEPLLPDAPP